jgi:acetylornithine deacetylase/succinyl-diaminopimelate desuccinylase-like protein
MAGGFADLETYLDATAEARLADYLEFLRIPSVSTLPEHAPDVRRAAEWVAARMRAAGLEHVEVAETGGHPVVYGDWLHAPGAPTVVAYAHYDVQPADPLELWVCPPFEPRVENGRVYARGAADDKAQVHLHLAAAEAWLRVRGGLPINLKFVIEGEEESGSDNLDRWLAANRERLAADLVVVSDTGFFDGNLPAITVGLRGIMYAQVDVAGPRVDLHSGSYGGTVANPANALASIIARLHAPDGRVDVPGFYDDVVPLSERDRAEFARMPFDEEAYREAIGVPALAGEAGYGTLERRGARPTLDINGIWGGFQGEGAKTIIPAHAHAKLSCRLVPNQDANRVFEQVRNRILALAPAGVRVDVTLIHGAAPFLTPVEHPATRAAAACLEELFGRAPLYIREGGSIPVTSSFQRVLEVPVVLLGFSPPDDQAHAPNESMRLDNYEGGIRTIMRYWSAVGSAVAAADIRVG